MAEKRTTSISTFFDLRLLYTNILVTINNSNAITPPPIAPSTLGVKSVFSMPVSVLVLISVLVLVSETIPTTVVPKNNNQRSPGIIKLFI